MASGVTRRLLIQCGAAETRGALFDGDEAAKFWFAPARGDEALPRAAEDGDIRLGRITSVSKVLSGAFIDIGDEVEAFCPFKKAQPLLIEGASVIFRVRRPALGGKGAVVALDWRGGVPPSTQRAYEAAAARDSKTRLFSAPVDAAVAIARNASAYSPEEIVIDSPDAALALNGEEFAARIDGAVVHERNIEGEIEYSLARRCAIAGAGEMIFDETEALTAVDIDLGSAAAGSGHSKNDTVNTAVARAIFRELSRRGVGGRIVIDFLPPSSPKTRASLAALLDDADRDLFERRAGKLAPDGLYDLTAPRRGPSLLERATEIAGGDWVRPGRRFTLDWLARAAIAGLERRLRRSRSGFFTLLAPERLASYLADRQRWIDRVKATFGGRITIAESSGLGEKSFDIVEKQSRA